jgi:hypothetical protein
MKKHGLFAAILLVALPLLLPQRAKADAIFSVSAPGTVTVGEAFVVDVNISNVADLYAFQFDLGFNASVFSATFAGEGALLPAAGATFFIPGAIDNAGGSILSTADTLLSAVPGANGGGTLAVFDFTAIGSGTSPITLSNVLLLDSKLNSLSASVRDGSVAVSPVPEPSSLLLFLAGLAGLFAVASSRKRFKSVTV